jgi:hypothetical protein
MILTRKANQNNFISVRFSEFSVEFDIKKSEFVTSTSANCLLKAPLIVSTFTPIENLSFKELLLTKGAVDEETFTFHYNISVF